METFMLMSHGLEFCLLEIIQKLTPTELSLQGRRYNKPTKLYQSFPERIVNLLAHDLYVEEEFEIAMGLLSAFDVSMRVGNLCRFIMKYFIFVEDRRNACPVALTVEKTRTGELQGLLV